MKKYISIIFLLFSVVLTAQSFSNGQIYVEVTDAGSTLLGAPNKQTLQVTRISILVSGDQYKVFDYLNDADRADTSAYSLTVPRFGNFNLFSSFDNSYSFAPPAYKVQLNSYGWLNAAYAVSHYNITNTDSLTYNAKVGFEILPFIDNVYGNEFVEYYEPGDYIRIRKDTTSTLVGIKILSSPMTSFYAEDWFSGYNRSDSALYDNLFYEGIVDTFFAADSGSVLFPSIAPEEILPGNQTDVYIALAIGMTDSQLDSNMALAVDKYNQIITTDNKDDKLPNKITLYQNYPNPFNPSTTIKFTITKKQLVEIKIYNSIGQLVKELVNKEFPEGVHKIIFDASGFASGVYFYRMKTDDFLYTKKMIILK